MLACFAKGSGLDGRGSKRQRLRQPQDGGGGSYLSNPSAEEEDQVYNQLAALTESLLIRQRERVEEVLLGAGANGVAFVEGPRVSVAFEGDIAVYFQGSLNRHLSNDAESPAHDILHKYACGQFSPSESFRGNNLNMGDLSGDFAMIIFDKLAGRVLAARDPRGTEPLFWGTSNFGESLLFSNDRQVLEMNCADADAFPPGTLFSSECGEVTGELTMLMSDDWEEEEDGGWEDVDFLVQDGQEAMTTKKMSSVAAAAAAGSVCVGVAQPMSATLAGDRRSQPGSVEGTVANLSHCKRSFQDLRRVESEERSMHGLHGSESEKNLRDNNMHRVGSQGEVHAAA